MNNKNLWVGLLVVLVIAIGGYLYPQVKGVFGVAGETNYNTTGVTGLKVGTSCGDSFSSTAANGCDTVTKFLVGTCNLTQSVPGSFVASTTGQFMCAVTGVLSGDNVYVTMPQPYISSGNPYLTTVGAIGMGNGFIVSSAYASTTDVIGVDLTNYTGAATSSFRWATTGVQYLIVR